MEESLEEFLKKDVEEQIDDLLFSNYVEKGQALSIKEKNESTFLDKNMGKILNQIKYEEKYKRYENLKNNPLYWKVKMIGGQIGTIVQQSVYNYFYKFEQTTINNNSKSHFDISFGDKKVEIKFSSQFTFEGIKPDYFDFILFIGFDENLVFYFEIMTKEEVNNYIAKHNLSYQRKEGYTISANDTSFFRFGNHLSYSDIINFIETS